MFSELTIVTASCFGLFFLGPTIAASAAVMGPVLEPARHVNSRPRVALIDVCCLIVLVQLALALPLAGRTPGSYPWLAAIILLALLGRGWWRGVVALSRSNIAQSLRRGVFLLLVVPIAYLWIIFMFAGLLSALPALDQRESFFREPGPELSDALLQVIGTVGMIVVSLWIAYRASQWVARGATSDCLARRSEQQSAAPRQPPST